MSSIINILLAILVISVVIIFHEFGHFLLAKANGIEVVEFSLGMGPRILSKQIGKTRYSWKLFPLGGSCQMLGEDEGNDEPGSFNSKNVWQRISVVLAGPVFNFILAFGLAAIIIGYLGIDTPYVGEVDERVTAQTDLQPGDIIKKYNGHSISMGRELSLYEQLDGIENGIVTLVVERDGKEIELSYESVHVEQYYLGIVYSVDPKSQTPMTLSGVTKDGAAEKAGLTEGDVITAIGGQKITSGKQFSEYMDAHPLDGSEVTLTYERDGEENTVALTPKFSESYTLGFSYNVNNREKQSALGVVKYSALELKYWVKATVKSLGYMLQGKASSEDIGGPVRVVSEMSDVVEESYSTDGALYAALNLINWAILLSANLGVMNLLPIPALDGGRLLFFIIEVIRGKKMDPNKEGFIHFVGFVLLMILMVFIFFNDIRNLIR